jgi:hypothetical protein
MGDEPHKRAPVRKVNVVAYDGNKYATVRLQGETGDVWELSVKCGYLYRAQGRLGQVKPINRRKLERFAGCTYEPRFPVPHRAYKKRR